MSSSSIASENRERAIGIALVFVATTAWSFSGVFTRLLTTDIWTAIAWRSFFGGLFLLGPYLFSDRGKPGAFSFAFGWPGFWLLVSQVLCQSAMVGALTHTTVANVTVIYATAPFIAAALAWWQMGERVRPRTLVASLAAFAGTLVIISGSFGHGNLLGDGLALIMSASFAVIIVIPRAYPGLQTLPTTILSAFVTTIIFAPFGSVGSLDAWNWTVLAAFGLTNFSFALFLFVAGARRIRSAEAALIGILEIVFAPLWVWLMFQEAPGWAAAAGGAIIAAAVIWHTVLDFGGDRTNPVPQQSA